MNEAVMSRELEQPGQLSRAERLQLTWALAWPVALLDLVYGLVRSQLGLSEAQLQSIDGLLGILQLFLLDIWVVRRTVRLDFPGFHLVAIRGEAPNGTRTLSYLESLSVAWLICWRSSMIVAPVYLALWVVLRRPPEEYSPIGWLASTAAELLILYLWIVTAALNKSYARFSLRVYRP